MLLHSWCEYRLALLQEWDMTHPWMNAERGMQALQSKKGVSVRLTIQASTVYKTRNITYYY